jgi:[ribosomal protein S5]-alanine N-acetyltransferase
VEPDRLEGRLIYLRKPTYEDASLGPWYNWFNDPESTRFTRHGRVENTRADQIAFFRDSEGDVSRQIFAICDRESGNMIGVTSLQEIDVSKRQAEIAIMIGDRDFRHKGISIEAWGLLIQYGFDNLEIDRIWGGSHEGLRNWVNSLFRLGFRIESEVLGIYSEDDDTALKLQYACYRNDFDERVSRLGAFDIETWK